MERPTANPAMSSTVANSAPTRKRSDYRSYYHDMCRKLAPRQRAFDHHAYEATLALLMFDFPAKTEAECVIALAKMELYAPFVRLD